MTKIDRTIVLAADLTIAWLRNPNTRLDPDEGPAFLASAHDALLGLDSPKSPPEEVVEEAFVPAVSARKSLASRDRIISMIDGKPYMSLVRHLKLHEMTPAQYRERFGLKSDYPMVAPSYSEARRAMALKIGLGDRAAAAREAAAAARAAAAGKGDAAESGPRIKVSVRK